MLQGSDSRWALSQGSEIKQLHEDAGALLSTPG